MVVHILILGRQMDKYAEDYERHYVKFGIEGSGGGDSKLIGLCELSILIASGLSSNHTILDFGCGIGRLTPFVSEYLTNGSYLGSDISETALTLAKQNNKRVNCDFILTNSQLLDNLKSWNFDFICCFSVFTHVEFEDFYNILQELKSVSTTTTKLVCSFLDIESDYGSKIFLDESAISYQDRYKRTRNIVSNKELVSSISKLAGWQMDDFYGVGFDFKNYAPIQYTEGNPVKDLKMGQWVGVFQLID
jgi:2-polyprenyl-3-methyl-5-hydroxy-6-metoxy-1,4-benzoquinol methylase